MRKRTSCQINGIVSRHVEVVSLLQRMINTRQATITLDVDMEDYHRIVGDRADD